MCAFSPHCLTCAVCAWTCSYVPINHGITSQPGHQFHPWRLLSELALEEDFVIVKLDIGAPTPSCSPLVCRLTPLAQMDVMLLHRGLTCRGCLVCDVLRTCAIPDSPYIELPLFDQLLEYAALIDEFAFEHHTTTPPMRMFWSGHRGQDKLADSYEKFLKLRRAGIRAHSWP
jgi:hypothetical protein